MTINSPDEAMIPLYDSRNLSRVPYATYGIIALNILVFLWQLTLSNEAEYQAFIDYALVPKSFFAGGEATLGMLRYMFIHGGWFHLASNMLFLFIFGDDVEDWLGIPLYLAFYAICGIGAGLAQAFFSPSSVVPIVGASGAISGVLGGFYVLFPKVPIHTLTLRILFARQLDLIPADLVLILWFAFQIIGSLLSVNGESNVAFLAHIGGYVIGFLLMHLYARFYGYRDFALLRGGSSSPPPSETRTANQQPFTINMRRPTSNPTSQRSRDPIPFPGQSSTGGTGRSPNPTKRYSWKEDDARAGRTMKEMEENIEELRTRLGKLREERRQTTTSGKPTGSSQIEFGDLSDPSQRAKAVQILAKRQGENLLVETLDSGKHQGKVVLVNNKQLVLQDESGKKRWITLQNIARISS